MPKLLHKLSPSVLVVHLVKSKMSSGFLNKGKQKLKNIKEEITCYYVDINTGSADPKTFKPNSSLGASNKPIISIVAASLIGILLATSYFLYNRDGDKATEFNILAVSPINFTPETTSKLASVVCPNFAI